MKRIVFLFFILFLSNTAVSAKVSLPAMFTSHMVLQQRAENRIWGKADPGSRIELTTGWDGRRYQGLADKEGDWQIEFITPAYGGPYTIDISDGDTIRLDDILIGEVWLCSGQSNMEMPLAGWGEVTNFKEEIANANYPQIRLLQTEHVTSNVPLENVALNSAGWEVCSPQTVADFSSVAYFFAREIYKKTNVPIGLIHTSWGGTVAEAWVSKTSLSSMPDFKEVGTKLLENDGPNRPTVLYNAMIHPFINYRIKGVIWYQGESNADRAEQYQTLFPLLIRDWRAQWGSGDFPFYFVQLANFMKKDEGVVQQSNWAELREAQRQTLAVPNTGMAVSIDIGDAEDIHPKNKYEVGRRLALIALNRSYGEKNEYSGPMVKSLKKKKSEIHVKFDHAAGLNSKGTLAGFSVAGSDGIFHPAEARIVSGRVVVTSAVVNDAVEIRYGWANNPDANLYNGAGLPASPFRMQL